LSVGVAGAAGRGEGQDVDLRGHHRRDVLLAVGGVERPADRRAGRDRQPEQPQPIDRALGVELRQPKHGDPRLALDGELDARAVLEPRDEAVALQLDGAWRPYRAAPLQGYGRLVGGGPALAVAEDQSGDDAPVVHLQSRAGAQVDREVRARRRRQGQNDRRQNRRDSSHGSRLATGLDIAVSNKPGGPTIGDGMDAAKEAAAC